MGIRERIAAMTPGQLRTASERTKAYIDDLAARGLLDEQVENDEEVGAAGEAFMAFASEVSCGSTPQ